MKTERDIFAVCDLEVEYAYHFMEFISKKKSIPLEIRVFTNVQALSEFLQEHQIELLLISENAMCEEIQTQKIGQIVILASGIVPDYLKKYPSVYKYQSSNRVIRETMVCYGESQKNKGKQLRMTTRDVEIIGIYSPVGRTMKTTFALTLGQILAKKKAVLYLNLEEYSGFEYLLEQSYEQNLGDLLYYLRQGEENLIGKLNEMVRSMNNLDFLPPVLSPGDIQQTSLEAWMRLLQEIIDYSNYEVIILDLGDCVTELYQLLEQCGKIYMPIRTDPMSQAKISQFENLLRVWGKVAVINRIQKIRLPYHRTIHRGSGYLDDLVWSELGDFVRELIRQERSGNLEWRGNSLEVYEENS